MKKVFLFIFLIAFVAVNAKTYRVSTSTSPPSSSVTIKDCATTLMSQVAETPRIDAVLFECDVSYSVSSENCQSVIPATTIVQCAVNSQLVNQNYASVFFGKSDVLLQATSPQCRAVMQSFSLNNMILQPAASSIIQAVSPNCRDVLSIS